MQSQFAGEGQAVEPAAGGHGRLVVLLGHAHPSQQYVPARARERLRCVELEAVVQLPERFGHPEREGTGGAGVVGKQVADHVPALVAVPAFVAVLGADSLRRNDQDVVLHAGRRVRHAQQVRAFPHVPAGGGAVEDDLAAPVPSPPVGGIVQQRGAAAVVGLRAEQHPPSARDIRIRGDHRIPVMGGVARRRPGDERVRRVLHGRAQDSVGAGGGGGQALRRTPDVAHRDTVGEPLGQLRAGQGSRPRQVSGVEKLDRVAGALRGDRSAGEAAVGVVLLAGRQHRRVMAPLEQVRRRGVAPARPPRRMREPGVPLVTHVPGPVQVHEPVRVVEAALRRGQVERRPVPVSRHGLSP